MHLQQKVIALSFLNTCLYSFCVSTHCTLREHTHREEIRGLSTFLLLDDYTMEFCDELLLFLMHQAFEQLQLGL